MALPLDNNNPYDVFTDYHHHNHKPKALSIDHFKHSVAYIHYIQLSKQVTDLDDEVVSDSEAD